MTTKEFEAFVETHVAWFRGRRRESAVSIGAAEVALGVSLPESMKWVLVEHGYWHGTSVSNLGETVDRTLQLRVAVGLDQRYVVLEDWGDAGLVVIDTEDKHSPGEPILLWADAHALHTGPDWPGSERFQSFGAYVASQLETIREEYEGQRIAYDPDEDESPVSG